MKILELLSLQALKKHLQVNIYKLKAGADISEMKD
jgi:hypothetical protein